jgi:cell division protein FtsB
MLAPKKTSIKNLAISALLLVLSFSLIKSTLEVFKGGERMKSLENEVIDLENKKKELEESIEYKKSEEYIEEKARNDLNLIKPGESIYVISGPGSENYSERKVLSRTSDRTKKTAREDANWYKWYRLFF